MSVTGKYIRDVFIDFFRQRQHVFAPPSPIVNKDDQTLMFTNAGMNQFKDIFLGTKEAHDKRLVNSQLCLRVSGKHNDLEEVGVDTYHHTLFEMLGNWSMNDYFKDEAISLAWELLTDVYKIAKDRLYVTVFEGDTSDQLESDTEALYAWRKFVQDDHIVYGNKHDNFWEMGDVGPCGPCTEIHIDLRSESEIDKVSGRVLVNTNHPDVIEVWNIVFMQYERLSNGNLKKLSKRYIDTGMGFERLVMILQEKKSSYDTDIFRPYIEHLEKMTNIKYGMSGDIDIAIRVIVDHVRTVVLTVAEGTIPSNTQEGYVVRKILRRAIRYGYRYLGLRMPFLCSFVDTVLDQYTSLDRNIGLQRSAVEQIVKKEEEDFFKTINDGIERLHPIVSEAKRCGIKTIDGDKVFELYDTYGIPVDLITDILCESGLTFDKLGFDDSLTAQKNRSRHDSEVVDGDWVIVNDESKEDSIIGCGDNQCSGCSNCFLSGCFTSTQILKYKKLFYPKNNETVFYIALKNNCLFCEGCGQVGDTGTLRTSSGEAIKIINTKKIFGQAVCITKALPMKPCDDVFVIVDSKRHDKISANHTCTHLLQAVLRTIFGDTIKQCGSHIDDKKLRFDFNFDRLFTSDEIRTIEQHVNAMIRSNLIKVTDHMTFSQAKHIDALARFDDKFQDTDDVSVVSFIDDRTGEVISREVCAGTHVELTGNIGLFVITSNTSIASGIKRIEAITGEESERYLGVIRSDNDKLKAVVKSDDIVCATQKLIDLNVSNSTLLNSYRRVYIDSIVRNLNGNAVDIGGIKWIIESLTLIEAPIDQQIVKKVISSNNTVAVIMTRKTSTDVRVIVGVSSDICNEIPASGIVKHIKSHLSGNGGGNNSVATFTCSDSESAISDITMKFAGQIKHGTLL